MKDSKQLFTMVSNDALTTSHERKLNEKELYFLIYASVSTNQIGETIVCHGAAFEEIKLFNDNKESRYKAKTKEVVQSLEAKGYIAVEDKGKYMKVTFVDKPKENFTRIYHDEFIRFRSNPLDLYIYACVAKWSRNGVAEYPISVWGQLLQLGETQTIATIKDAVEREVIYKEIGKWVGLNQRESNKYSTKPFIKKLSELEEPLSPKVEKIVVKEKIKDIENEMEHNHQWFATQKTLFTVDDFVVLLTTDDEKIKKAAKKHIDRISTSDGGKWSMEELKRQAQEKIAKEKKEAELAREEELKPLAYKIMDESKDIVLLVDGKLIKYADFKHGDAVKKAFYFRLIDIPELGGYSPVFEVKSNPSDIEKYREKNNKCKDYWQKKSAAKEVEPQEQEEAEQPTEPKPEPVTEPKLTPKPVKEEEEFFFDDDDEDNPFNTFKSSARKWA